MLRRLTRRMFEFVQIRNNWCIILQRIRSLMFLFFFVEIRITLCNLQFILLHIYIINFARIVMNKFRHFSSILIVELLIMM